MIDDILSRSAMDDMQIDPKTTFLSVTLPHGYTIVETYVHYDSEYDHARGMHKCLKKIKRRLAELEAYRASYEGLEPTKRPALLNASPLPKEYNLTIKTFDNLEEYRIYKSAIDQGQPVSLPDYCVIKIEECSSLFKKVWLRHDKIADTFIQFCSEDTQLLKSFQKAEGDKTKVRFSEARVGDCSPPD